MQLRADKSKQYVVNKNEYKLYVDKCPKMLPQPKIVKEKLLGYWFAYIATPLPTINYNRRCASYNVRGSPYFKNNIIYTNHKDLVVTYFCDYDEDRKMFKRKLRVLTRNRTPNEEMIAGVVFKFLMERGFPIEALDWLKTEAYCFEWYQLNFEIHVRPKAYQAPFNDPGPLGR
ncbi:uncharacterized protein LOC117135009 [Drosophila busckii]|uniref:uncharacterized protein LOC117135009 n=1 Tax=Drosophila busckii TaxID=30019 RepID=UPI001432993B|nr:uncharacterized protein LOC117135009 [Drosophila busckii]